MRGYLGLAQKYSGMFGAALKNYDAAILGGVRGMDENRETLLFEIDLWQAGLHASSPAAYLPGLSTYTDKCLCIISIPGNDFLREILTLTCF